MNFPARASQGSIAAVNTVSERSPIGTVDGEAILNLQTIFDTSREEDSVLPVSSNEIGEDKEVVSDTQLSKDVSATSNFGDWVKVFAFEDVTATEQLASTPIDGNVKAEQVKQNVTEAEEEPEEITTIPTSEVRFAEAILEKEEIPAIPKEFQKKISSLSGEVSQAVEAQKEEGKEEEEAEKSTETQAETKSATTEGLFTETTAAAKDGATTESEEPIIVATTGELEVTSGAQAPNLTNQSERAEEAKEATVEASHEAPEGVTEVSEKETPMNVTEVGAVASEDLEPETFSETEVTSDRTMADEKIQEGATAESLTAQASVY
uniref:Uncharacterized protein n=1 Tax=Parascaris equorum TaxID=6256 RepID=A0A914RPV8_PAREQ